MGAVELWLTGHGILVIFKPIESETTTKGGAEL